MSKENEDKCELCGGVILDAALYAKNCGSAALEGDAVAGDAFSGYGEEPTYRIPDVIDPRTLEPIRNYRVTVDVDNEGLAHLVTIGPRPLADEEEDEGLIN